MPAIRTAAGAAPSTTAAAPSEIGQQWNRRSGSATTRLSSTSSIATACWKWASGLRVAFAWFLTATCEISRAVTPCRVIKTRVTSPASAGMVAP